MKFFKICAEVLVPKFVYPVIFYKIFAAILYRNFSFWAGQLRTINVDLAISLVPKKIKEKYAEGSTRQIQTFMAVRGSLSCSIQLS